MKRKILLAVALVFAVSAVAAQPANSTSEVKPGLTPGSFLYPVENFVESLEVRMAGLVGGPDLKAKAIANNAEERLAEAEEFEVEVEHETETTEAEGELEIEIEAEEEQEDSEEEASAEAEVNAEERLNLD